MSDHYKYCHCCGSHDIVYYPTMWVCTSCKATSIDWERESIIARWYRYIWSRIGGRPWTHITRDFCRSNPLALLIITSIIAILIGKTQKGWNLARVLLGIGAGIVIGHIFW